jgi:hypothetical protein
MADHSLGTVYYGLKAVKITGGSVESEINWQVKNMPNDIKKLVLEGLKNKKIIK